MKYLFTVLLLVLFVTNVQAASFCQWDGSGPVNCKTPSAVKDADGNVLKYIFYPKNAAPFVFSESNANDRGYYESVTVTPVGDTRDTSEYSFSNNTITLTWTMRDYTTEEVNNTKCSLIIQNLWVMKKLVAKGVLSLSDFTVDVEQYPTG